jgi:hypothetical protein
MTLLTVQWSQYVGGPAADVTSQTVTATPAAGGAPVLGPTGTGIVHVATGFYSYLWDTSVVADGNYLVAWNALNSLGDAVQASELVTVSAAVLGSWADVSFVYNLTGETVTAVQLNLAQGLIEGVVRRIYRATDVTDPDYYWLRRAVAVQATFVKAHPELLEQANITSTSQDGWAVNFRDDNREVWMSGRAWRYLNNLRHGANTAVHANSAFQRSGRMWRRMQGWGW